MASVSLNRLIEKMKLENLTPELDLDKKKLTQPDINRPALQLAGYFEHFDATRLQIIGFVEYTYLEGLEEARKRRSITSCSLMKFRHSSSLGSYSLISCSCSMPWNRRSPSCLRKSQPPLLWRNPSAGSM